MSGSAGFATPKSVSDACSISPRRSTSTFEGLTSRCTRPFACAASSAAAIWPTSATARAGLEPPLPPEQRTQILPLHEADGEKQVPARLPRLVNRQHVRMLDRRRQPRLPQEAHPIQLVLGQRRRQHLERHHPIQRALPRPVDDPHPTTADELLDLEAGEDDAGLEAP